MYSVPFQPCPSMEEWLCSLLDQPFHGWWLHHVPHLHPGTFLLLVAGAVGALRGPFVGSDSRGHHGHGQHQQQGQCHRADGREHAGDQVSCQLQGWKQCSEMAAGVEIMQWNSCNEMAARVEITAME